MFSLISINSFGQEVQPKVTKPKMNDKRVERRSSAKNNPAVKSPQIRPIRVERKDERINNQKMR